MRVRAVAEGVDERVYAHKLRFLTFDESWKLFEQRAFGNMQRVDEDLQKIGKEMVQKCGGLPLAIVVLAGLLSRMRKNEWHEMCTSLWRRLKDNSIHVSTSVFDLRFKEMRQELKLCFLYLSVFPEDYEINVKDLIRLLVAEGFIQKDEEMTMEDLARYYIEELIDRSLVKAEKIERRKVMSCRIHDLLRDVAIKKAKELNFVNVYNDQHSSTSCRREVSHHLINNRYLCDRRVNKGLRSLLFFGQGPGISGGYVETFTLKLKLLRVLNLGGLMFLFHGEFHFSLPAVIGELIHLRYLGVADTGLNNLPAFISNLRFLQTLDAGGKQSLDFERTTDLSKLTSLRHVIGKFVGELLIGDAGNLQTLRSISSYSWSKLKHESLKNLRDLEIYDQYSTWEHQKIFPLDLVSLSKLTNLRVLKLEVKIFNLLLSESEEAVRFQFLVELTLHCDIRKLPKDMDLIFPSLEMFRLQGSKLEEDPMLVLQKLPRLEDLVLEYCHQIWSAEEA
ncbi:unnamed protein product [Arabis nemorensis]|uniref:Uncharacterized protein n=1 Tax=Arabis nemorensis TaxID=586526 RepID=A0A565BTA1_9BRAS|nr:unnamed protein product [Arabis nemorensis]